MTDPYLRLLSLGAGVQSTTLLLLSASGELPKLDAAIFADTGWEPEAVYKHLDRLEQEVAGPAGIPIYRVSRGNLRDDLLNPDKMAMIPAYTASPAGTRGMLKRKCTLNYKLGPIRAKTRLLLGAAVSDPKPCRYCEGTGTRVAPWRAKRGEEAAGTCSVCDGAGETFRIGTPPAKRWAEQWVGFSTDEIIRVSGHTDTRYVRSRYPLLDLNMSREQCLAYLKHHGWKSVAKSACNGCPYHGNRHWRKMRDEQPAEFADAVAFDEEYRRGPGMESERFLHISCKPLNLAPIETAQRTDLVAADIFDAIYEARLEEGEPDGCSPHGCRSGEAVA